MDEKLQKVLARCGFASRRELEEWIKAGRVEVNGKVASLGDRVTPQDRIRVDGKPVRISKPKTRVIAYHKPIGEICTRQDPEGRETIFENLPKLRDARWVAIGRLDINTCGLILLTTNGELANRLMHPSSQIEREYAVRVMGEVSEGMLELLQKGILLEDGEARFDSVRLSGGEGVNQWYHVTLKEGRYREVRRLWEAVGATVSRLIRVRFASVELGRFLKPGQWRELNDGEVGKIMKLAGMDVQEKKAENPVTKSRAGRPVSKKKPHKKKLQRKKVSPRNPI